MLESINRNQLKLFGAIAVVLLIVGGTILATSPKKPTGGGYDLKIAVWGVGLTSAEMQPALDAFSAAYTQRYGNKLLVEYTSWPLEQYEDVLVNKIAEGKGPDVAFVKNTWMLKHYTKLIPLPENFTGFIPRTTEADIGVWTPEAYEATFVKTVPKDFMLSKRIYAVPLHVDTLALYYNEDHYTQAGIELSRPATTWDGIAAQAPQLVRQNLMTGGIRRAAVAMGSVKNVRLHVQRADTSTPTVADNGSDIVSMLLLQQGGVYCKESCTQAAFGAEGRDALTRFLRFATPEDPAYTWSPTFTQDLGLQYVDDSVDAFLSGAVSSILGYSDLYTELTSRSTGDRFSVKVAAIPQSDDERRVALASYWGVAVTKSAGTKFQEANVNQAQTQASLELVAYMGRQGPQMELFRASKRPPAREDLLQKAAAEEKGLAPLIRQAQIAASPQIYDEEQLKDALTAAFDRFPANRPGAVDSIDRAVQETLQKMVTNGGRTPVPPKPSTPPGVKR